MISKLAVRCVGFISLALFTSFGANADVVRWDIVGYYNDRHYACYYYGGPNCPAPWEDPDGPDYPHYEIYSATILFDLASTWETSAEGLLYPGDLIINAISAVETTPRGTFNRDVTIQISMIDPDLLPWLPYFNGTNFEDIGVDVSGAYSSNGPFVYVSGLSWQWLPREPNAAAGGIEMVTAGTPISTSQLPTEWYWDYDAPSMVVTDFANMFGLLRADVDVVPTSPPGIVPVPASIGFAIASMGILALLRFRRTGT